MSQSRPKVLILYASTHGQTEKIASQLGVTMALCDLQVMTRNLRDSDHEDPKRYDAVVLTECVHAGHHQREIVNWLRRNIESVKSRPNAFVSVSLSSAEDDEEVRAEPIEHIDDFTRDTRWSPDHTAPVAAALLHREPKPFRRILTKLHVKKDGQPANTREDYEYTDWEALTRFGQEIAADFKERISA